MVFMCETDLSPSPHLVVKVSFCSCLGSQPQLSIGYLLSVMLETSDGHGQHEHPSHDCHGN